MIINKIKIDNAEFDYNINENNVELNDRRYKIEILKRFSNDYYELLVNEKKVIIGIKKDNNQFQIYYKNRIFDVELIDSYTSLKKSMTQLSGTGSYKTSIKAPMPGLVIKINKNPNDRVQKGETVLIIEAMKMENSIKSPVEGIITSFKVNLGNTVAKNDVLFEIE